MNEELDQVTLASLPLEHLGVLAQMRRDSGITVAVRGERAWVSWGPGQACVARLLLPVPDVQLFSTRGDHHYRLGSLLPCGEVPGDLEATAVSLVRALTPDAARIHSQAKARPNPLPFALVRDDRARPASATLCPWRALAGWADRATRHEIESLKAARSGDLALLIGDALPHVEGAVRFWGGRMLVPLGFRPEPSLEESCWVLALALQNDDLALVHLDALVEVVPGTALGPLTRASLRMTLEGGPP